jgi:hypothetical protein
LFTQGYWACNTQSILSGCCVVAGRPQDGVALVLADVCSLRGRAAQRLHPRHITLARAHELVISLCSALLAAWSEVPARQLTRRQGAPQQPAISHTQPNTAAAIASDITMEAPSLAPSVAAAAAGGNGGGPGDGTRGGGLVPQDDSLAAMVSPPTDLPQPASSELKARRDTGPQCSSWLPVGVDINSTWHAPCMPDPVASPGVFVWGFMCVYVCGGGGGGGGGELHPWEEFGDRH